MSAEAGWYTDPTDDASVRWWDGAVWTTDVRPAPRELVSVGAPEPVHSSVVPEPVAALLGSAHAGTLAAAQARATEPLPTHTVAPAPQVIPDRSRPGSAPPREVLAPEPLAGQPSAAPHDTFVAMTTATASSGFAAATPATFGSTGPRSQFGGASGYAPSRPDSAGPHTSLPSPKRHWVRTTFLCVLALALLGVAGAVAVPRYVESKAATAAAAEPDLVSHVPTATLAGLHRLVGVGGGFASEARALTTQGSAWAWAQAYGTRAATTYVLATDLTAPDRAKAYRAVTGEGRAQDLLDLVTAEIGTATGAADIVGDATQYASPIGGKVWCMPYSSHGVGGGLCVWTNGRQSLSTLSMPGVQESAARTMISALAQMGRLASRTSSTRTS